MSKSKIILWYKYIFLVSLCYINGTFVEMFTQTLSFQSWLLDFDSMKISPSWIWPKSFLAPMTMVNRLYPRVRKWTAQAKWANTPQHSKSIHTGVVLFAVTPIATAWSFRRRCRPSRCSTLCIWSITPNRDTEGRRTRTLQLLLAILVLEVVLQLAPVIPIGAGCWEGIPFEHNTFFAFISFVLSSNCIEHRDIIRTCNKSELFLLDIKMSPRTIALAFVLGSSLLIAVS